MAIGKQVAEAYIEVNGDLSPFRRDLERARAMMAKHNKSIEKDNDSTWKRIGDSARKAMQKVTGAWSRMDRTVKLVLTLIAAAGDQMATLGSGLAASGTALISTFGMALANLIPLVATLPGLAYGIGLSVSAIKRMKDAGGEAAKAIASIGKAYRDSAVPAFTKEWEASVTSFAKTLAEKLGDTSVPKALGKAFAEITDAFTGVMNSPSYTAFEEAMSTTLAAAVGNLGETVAMLTKGLMELFAGAGPAAERLTESFRQWGVAWSKSMSQMRQDGTLQRVFDTAYTSGAAMMNLTGALGRAMGSVFMIGAKYGDDLANSLAAVTNQFTAWSKTAEGQAAINKWFADGVRIIKAMEPMVVGLGRAMSILVTEAAIVRWEKMNQSMGRMLPALAQLLHVIGSLDLLGSLVAIFEGLFTAIAVIAAPLEQIALIIGGLLRSAIDAASYALLGMAAALVGPLEAAVPGIKAIADVIGSAFMPMAQIVVSVFKLILMAVTPAIEIISSAMMSLAPAIKQVIALFDDGLKNVLVGLEPVFTNIGTLLGTVAIAFGQLVTALMPSLALLATGFTSALSTLMPFLTSLVSTITGALAPAFVWLGQTFAILGPRIAELTGMFLTFISEGVAKIGPLLTTLGTVFTTVFNNMLPVIQLVGSVLMSAFVQLLPSLTSIATTIGTLLVGAFTTLMPVVQSLMPIIGSIVGSFMNFAIAVAPIVARTFEMLAAAILPLLPQIGAMVTQFAAFAATLVSEFLPALVPVIGQIGAGLVTVFTNLAPVVMSVISVVGGLAAMFIERLLPALLPLVFALVGFLVPAFKVLGDIVMAVMPIIAFIIEGVINNIIGVIQGVTRVISGVTDFIRAMFQGDWPAMWNALVNIVLGAVEAIWNFVQLTFIGKLVTGIKTGMVAIGAFFRSGWDNIVSGVSGALSSIVSFVVGGLSKMMSSVGSGIANIGNFFRNGWNGMVSHLSSAWSSMVSAVGSGIGNVMSFVGSLPGKIVSALSGLVGNMASAGRNMMQGMVNGIMGMAGNLLSSAMNAVKGAVDGVKNFLGIRSPSRLFMGIGEYMGEGAAIGMDNLKGRIKSAATNMAQAAVGAFDRSTMFLAGQNAGAGLADGLSASKSEIAGALAGMSKQMTVSAAAIGSGPIGSAQSGSPVVPVGGSGLTIAEGAIQIVTPTHDPFIVASKVLDDLTNFSML